MKIGRLLILFFPLFACFNLLHAQGYYETGMQRYIFADIANVRATPSIEAEIIDKLPAGHEVTIEEKSIADQIGNDEGVWRQITYTIKGAKKEGFLWEKTLSHTQMRRGNIKFVYGVDKEKEIINGQIPFQLKAIQDDNIIYRSSFTVPSGSLSYTEGKIKSNGYLCKIEYIVDLYFTGEACGYGNYHYNFGWTGSELLELPKTMSVSDGGIYSHGEYLIYPTENQLPENMILKVIKEGEAKDEDSDIEYQYKTEMYKWNGRSYSIVKQLE